MNFIFLQLVTYLPSVTKRCNLSECCHFKRTDKTALSSVISRTMWCLVLLCVCLVAQGCSENSPSVTIRHGQLRGAFLHSRGDRQFIAFKGIPYATPPLRELRFQKPVPAAAWRGVRDATNLGSPCIQLNETDKSAQIFGSEDCLYLNVYTPKMSKMTKYPVMIYIYGGGFLEGTANLYQPDYLMDRDIVLVTFNYRLGALGFLSMEDEELPGNNGLKDQTAVLIWVKENIVHFGGDRDSVTIFGHSSGAASVHYHMLSPLSKGLFHRGISQSGSAYCPWACGVPGQVRKVSEKFVSLLGCKRTSTHDTLACMRNISAHAMVETAATGLHEWNSDPVILLPPSVEPPGVEGAFLTTDPWKLTSDVPWIAGVTTAEANIKVKTFDDKVFRELNDNFEKVGPITLLFRTTAEDPALIALAVKKFYFDGDINPEDVQNISDMYSDCWLIHPMLESVRRHRGPKYLYYFDYRGSNSFTPEYSGVAHADELQYFFPIGPFLNAANSSSSEDLNISEKLIDLWTNFAIYGKPTPNPSSPTWAETKNSSEYLHITKSGFFMETNLLKERDNFWKTLPYREKYFSDRLKKDEL